MIEPNQPLDGRNILIAPDANTRAVTAELTRHGARVVVWPQVTIIEPDNYAALDESIQNLFGYDWLIFPNTNAVSFFLRRLQQTAHEISELDASRVCALNDVARQQLEESQVNVDLVPASPMTENVLAAIETYVGGRDSLRGLNFLLPRAAISSDPLAQALEDAGARGDVVAAYRTVSDNSELTRLRVLLEGGGIDFIAFTSPANVRALSQLLDTNDLSRLLKEVVVACFDEATAQAVAEFGIRADIIPREPTPLISALAALFDSSGHPVQNRLR